LAERCFRLSEDGVRLTLRVTPKAGFDRIEGIERRDDGTEVLRVRVRAVPDKGKANAAVVALLASALGVPKTAIELVAGDTARVKTLEISGDPLLLAGRLEMLAK
jgi:uncharacterized protein (TIGR00251 family)